MPKKQGEFRNRAGYSGIHDTLNILRYALSSFHERLCSVQWQPIVAVRFPIRWRRIHPGISAQNIFDLGQCKVCGAADGSFRKFRCLYYGGALPYFPYTLCCEMRRLPCTQLERRMRVWVQAPAILLQKLGNLQSAFRGLFFADIGQGVWLKR